MIQSNIKLPLSEIFKIYLKIGIQSVGGGFAMLTVLEHLMVKERKWITHDEFLQAITVGQSTPGVMICNVGGFIAFRLGGFPALIVAMTGMILPSFLVVLAFAKFYASAQEQVWLTKFFHGVGPGVVGVLLGLTFKIGQKNIKSIGYGLIVVAALVAAAFYNVHPIAIVLIAAFIGIFITFVPIARKVKS